MSVFASSIQNLFSQAPTSENEQRIKAYLEKFPKSDADDNGILTLQELLTHMRKTRKGVKSLIMMIPSNPLLIIPISDILISIREMC